MLLGPCMHSVCFAKDPPASPMSIYNTIVLFNRYSRCQCIQKHHLGTMHSSTGLKAVPHLKAPRFRVSPFWSPLRAMTQH